MFIFIKRLFCIHIYEYDFDPKYGEYREYRKCGKEDQPAFYWLSQQKAPLDGEAQNIFDFKFDLN